MSRKSRRLGDENPRSFIPSPRDFPRLEAESGIDSVALRCTIKTGFPENLAWKTPRKKSRVWRRTMPVTVAKIFRYPVKGLSAQELPGVLLSAGRGLPEDRRFALTHGAPAREGVSGWLGKGNFLTLSRFEKLATIQTVYEAESAVLTVFRNGRQITRGQLTSPTGRAVIEQFFAAFINGPGIQAPAAHASNVHGSGSGGGGPGSGVGTGGGPLIPRVVEAPGVMFSDREPPLVSLLNLTSVRDIERVVQKPVDPMRFRANFLLEGISPWNENQWIGRTICVGNARVEVVEMITRCPATGVNPVTGVRDINIPRALEKGYGHTHCGVYARVIDGGEVEAGAECRLE
jgi:uncharacterized protein YcbX